MTEKLQSIINSTVLLSASEERFMNVLKKGTIPLLEYADGQNGADNAIQAKSRDLARGVAPYLPTHKIFAYLSEADDYLVSLYLKKIFFALKEHDFRR